MFHSVYTSAGLGAGGGIWSAGILEVLGSQLAHNQALGGDGAAGANGGNGFGGGSMSTALPQPLWILPSFDGQPLHAEHPNQFGQGWPCWLASVALVTTEGERRGPSALRAPELSSPSPRGASEDAR
jgi:hypothetical protein